MTEYNTIGKNYIKKDVLDKVLGKAIFAADIEMDNMLYGAVKRSDVPSAHLRKVDISRAKALGGVVAVLTAKDIPGHNNIGFIIKDEPTLVSNKIRRVGDAIAIVAAETEEIAEKAVKLIDVEYEEITPIFTIEDALKEGSHKIHGDTNLLQSYTQVHGDVGEAFKQCDVVVENTYETSYTTHMYIEPEAGVASYENGIMKFWSSTQDIHYNRIEVARVLGLPYNRVRGIQAITGGGFGGKTDISVQCHVALLAYYTKRPVKMVRKREESTITSPKRHPMTMRYKTGATKDGKILALEASIISDTGAYASQGTAVATRSVVHATGPYEIPNVKVTAKFVYTNNPVGGAMRGFGVPQIAISHESQMDILAQKIGMSPMEIRFKNALRVGSQTSTGQKLYDSIGFVKTLKEAEKKAKEILNMRQGVR